MQSAAPSQPNGSPISHLAAALGQQQTTINLTSALNLEPDPGSSSSTAVPNSLTAVLTTPVTPAANLSPDIQVQPHLQQNAAANAQISAIAAALANNHPVPPINPGAMMTTPTTQVITSITAPGGTLPNGLPTVTAFPAQQLATTAATGDGGLAGVKLAYPIQTLLPGGILSSQGIQGQNVTIATQFPSQQLQFAIANAVTQGAVGTTSTYNPS